MTLSRSPRQLVLGVVVLLILVAVFMLIVDERCSRNLDAIDTTNEEMLDARGNK